MTKKIQEKKIRLRKFSFWISAIGMAILFFHYFSKKEELDDRTQNMYIYENGICTPISIPLEWQNSDPFIIGFERHPDCPRNLKLLALIESAPHHFEHRKILRQFFRRMRRSDIAAFFILGRSDVELIDEHENDIIIGDFIDSYSNLPSKTKIAYEYFANCEDPPEFLIVLDDDTVADIEAILERLDHENARAVYGKINKRVAVKNEWTEEKHLESKAFWPYTYWPDYIQGPCSFMNKEAALAIAEAAITAKEMLKVPIEDCVFTGILRVKGCVDILESRNQCHHLAGNLHKLKYLTAFDEELEL